MHEMFAFIHAFNYGDTIYLDDIGRKVNTIPKNQKYFFYNMDGSERESYEGVHEFSAFGEVSDLVSKDIIEKYNLIHLIGGKLSICVMRFTKDILHQFVLNNKREITFCLDLKLIYDSDKPRKFYKIYDNDSILRTIDFSDFPLHLEQQRKEDMLYLYFTNPKLH